MDNRASTIKRVQNAWRDLWQDWLQSVRDREGYFRRLARETVELRSSEALASRHYHELIAYYQHGDWKADRIPVDAVTRMLDSAKAAMDAAIEARTNRQWDLEKAVEATYHPDDYNTHSIVVRERLLQEASRQVTRLGAVLTTPSPLERLLAEQERLRELTAVSSRSDAEPIMD